MLRLAPSHPPLWRTPTSLQFGPDAVARLDDVAPWQERVLDALVDGIPDAMLVPLARAHGASAADAEAFRTRIGAALAAPSATPTCVRVELPADLGATDADAIVAALIGAGVQVESVTAWTDDSTRLPVVAVAHRLLDPRRAARFVARDTPHVPLELCGDRVSAGPLVVPGVTACLSCLHAHRRDADPSWPLVAAQLLGRSAVSGERALLMEGAVLAARLLQAGPAEVTRSVSVSARSAHRTWHEHRPHAGCLCRSPAGTATADAPAPRRRAPTTPRASARPA